MATGYKYVKYETDAGTIVRIRASSQTVSASGNTAPSGAIDDLNIFAYAANPGSKRKKQLNARGLRLRRELGTAPLTFNRYTFIPFFTLAGMAAVALESDITLGGVTWKVAEKVNEA